MDSVSTLTDNAIDPAGSRRMPVRRSLNALSALPYDWVAAGVGAALFIWLYVRNFWAIGDLWLMARVSKQFYAGHGLVWNYGESVWVYTSAMWQWMLIVTHGITGGAEPYYQALTAHSIAIGAMLVIVYWRWRLGRRFLLAALLFAGSTLVIDYASGGLENSIVYVAVAAVWALVMRGARLRWVSMAFGASLLVRHDMLLLLGPIMAYCLWKEARGQTETGSDLVRREVMISAVLAAAPLVLWTLFAWWHYDTVFPNSAAVKSSRFFGPHWPQYWTMILAIDTLGSLILTVGSLFLVYKGRVEERILLFGVMLYFIYISVAIASYDPTAGRHVSWCLFLVILMASDRLGDLLTPLRAWVACGAVACGLVLFGMLPGTHTPLFPAYNFWEIEDFEEVRQVGAKPGGHIDARYWNINSSLPAMLDYGGKPLAMRPDTAQARERERAWALWEAGETMFTPQDGTTAWVISYYVPLEMTVVEAHHHLSVP